MTKPRSRSKPVFLGLRTLRYKYVEYWTGVRELYDLDADPYELRNVADSAAARDLVTALSSTLRSLSSCQGAACRATEELQVP